MGTQNLNNYNFNRLDAKLNYSSYYDFFLVSDEKDFNTEVVWSDKIIGFGDTSVLPVLIDLNDPDTSSQPITACNLQYPTTNTSNPFTILSKFTWVSAKTICDCVSSTVKKICKVAIGQTAKTNGLYNSQNIANLQLSPPQDCVEIYKTLPVISTFNKLHFDKRFKMSQVRGFGIPTPGLPYFWTDTSIVNRFDSKVGYYQELKGGFYQGFYKLHGYDYEVLPTRPNKGWSFSTYLKPNTIGTSIEDCYNTSGYNGISSTTLCSNIPSGSVSTTMPNKLINYSWKNGTNLISGITNNSGFFFFKGTREGNGSDAYSNALGFRITDDMRIGYRTLRYTGDCVDLSVGCKPNPKWKCGWGLEESYSEPICPFISKSGNCGNSWLQVDVVFDRNTYLEDCDLLNKGGINDLITGTYPYSEDNICDTFIPGKLNLECSSNQLYNWFNEKDFRLGTLKFYVNGRIVHTVNNYEEIIPRHLNKWSPNRQFGVSYNMSWGGGAWGARENGKSTLQASDKIAKFFGGSFIGGISQMMYYLKPLTPDEVYHNFLINKDRYSLIDCEECKNCPGGCPDCLLPGEEPPEEVVCYNHVWSYCSSVESQITTQGGQVTGGTLETTFSGADSIVFIDNTIPGWEVCDNCQTNNSNLFWDSVGQPTVGTSLGGHYLTKNSDIDLYYSWACFTYEGFLEVPQGGVNNVNMISSSQGICSNTSGGTLPWCNSGNFAWLGEWDELSGGTAFENCCVCTEYLGPGCNAICPGGCMAYNAVNYDGDSESGPYCDCNGVNYNNGGYDISCCVFDPPCLPGCTDIAAINYDGNATCDCWGTMGGNSTHCCQYEDECVTGCTASGYEFYNSAATCDCLGNPPGTSNDFSCCGNITCVQSKCLDPTASNYWNNPSNAATPCDCLGNPSGTTNDFSCCEYCPCNVSVVNAWTIDLDWHIKSIWSCSTSGVLTNWVYPDGTTGQTYYSYGGDNGVGYVTAAELGIYGPGVYSFVVQNYPGGPYPDPGGYFAQTLSWQSDNPPCVIIRSVTGNQNNNFGCTDISGVNYDVTANIDDGSCTYWGCTDPTSFGYNPTASFDCSSVVGGTDYSCCLTSCDVCFTNGINGTWNVGQLNNNSYGWTGGTFIDSFAQYQENDTVIYNGCCYLCGEMNVGSSFPCSGLNPFENTSWLSCCPDACDNTSYYGQPTQQCIPHN